MEKNLGAFEAHEDRIHRELFEGVLPFFLSKKKQDTEMRMFMALCDFLDQDENQEHYLWNSLRRDDAEPKEILDLQVKKLMEELRYIWNETKQKYLKVEEFYKTYSPKWDKKKSYTTANGILVRFTQDGKYVALKKHTSGIWASKADMDDMFSSFKKTYDELTIPQFFRLHSSIAQDFTKYGEHRFSKYKTIKLFQEDLLTEKGIKSSKSNENMVYDLDRGFITIPTKEDKDINDALNEILPIL